MQIRLSRLFLLAAVVMALAHAWLGYGRLPERAASHFGAGGQADGWMGRGGLLATYAGVVLLMAAIPLALALVLRRMPDALINMPHKDYWLAPERREETLRRMTDSLCWLMAGTVVFLIWTFESVIRANQGPEPALSGGLWPLAVFLGWVGAWTVQLLLSFRRPKR